VMDLESSVPHFVSIREIGVQIRLVGRT
jgi:hypothetical protein